MSEMSKEKEMAQDKEVRQELDLNELDQVAGGGLFDELKQIGKSVWKDPGSM